MRDAAIRALLHMYATSPRCLARLSLGRHGAAPAVLVRSGSVSLRRHQQHHRFLSSSSSIPPLATRRRHLAAALGSETPVPPSATTIGVSQAPRRRGRRYYAAAPDTPKTVAVLGGGLTGLATAWHLARMLPPSARITLYEAGDRLGGWIDTEKVQVETADGRKGTVHFERAARMVKPQAGVRPLRWDDLLFFQLVRALNLTDKLECSREKKPVAGYIYYPDRLVPIPSPTFRPITAPLETLKSLGNLLQMLITEPLFRDVPSSLINFFRTKDSPYTREIYERKRDMSMGDYFTHRLGKNLVDKLLSATMHGIYGGDIYNLSMATSPWQGVLRPQGDEPITHTRVQPADYELMKDLLKEEGVLDLATEYLDAKALWFRDGFGTLTDALAEDLRKQPNVTIKMREPVTSVSYDGRSDRVMITTKEGQTPGAYEKVVSTIFAKTLADLTNGHLPSLAESSAVTIRVVNLWYPEMFANHPYHAFGYLLPQALSHDQNPECILGVIIDSDREFPIPTSSDLNPPQRTGDTIQGTKLTVMMGGHYWSGLPDSFLPDHAAAVEMAKRAVARHLNLPAHLSDQAVASSKLCRDCLPQPTVGHLDRMRAAHGELLWGFKGRLAVAGGSYTAPGVLPSLRAARDVAAQTAGAWRVARRDVPDPAADLEQPTSVGDTGLGRIAGGRPRYMVVEKRLCPLRFGSGAWVDGEGRVQPRVGASGALVDMEEGDGEEGRGRR